MVVTPASGPAVDCRVRPAAVYAAIACALTMTLLTGCYKRSVMPQSEGHITTPAAKPMLEGVPPPARVSSFVPAPKPAIKPPTYSVVVNEVPVKELLLALARDTKQNIDIHPGLSGLVSLNAIDETLPAILERIAKQINLRYSIDANAIVITPDSPYMKTYLVNYVNMSRDTTSTIGVSGQIQAGGSASGGSSGSGSGGGTNSSSTTVTTISRNNFWDALAANLRAILRSTAQQSLSDQQRSERQAMIKQDQEFRTAQMDAASRAGAGAAALASAVNPTGTAGVPPQLTQLPEDVIVNSVSGTVMVNGTEKQHQLVQSYLDSTMRSSQRQVLIDATIVEVTLSDAYQGGIDWSRVPISGGLKMDQLLIGSVSSDTISFNAGSLAVVYGNPNSPVGNISATVKLLSQFGNTRVLSSPKLMALNNQTALLKIVENLVYFSIQATTLTPATGPATTTFNTTAQTVPVGIVLSMTPQINENGQVTLTVRPTITRKKETVNDPNPSLCTKEIAATQKGGGCLTNLVPVIQTSEMESVLQLVSGQTAILGGLMKDNAVLDRSSVPGLGNAANTGALSELFSMRSDSFTKSELVIFLRATIITNPALDSDELKFYQRFLPRQTEAPTMTAPGEKVEAKPR